MEYSLLGNYIEVDNGDIIEIKVLGFKFFFKVQNASVTWQDLTGYGCDIYGNTYGELWDFGYFILYVLQDRLDFNMKVKNET